MQPQVHSDDKHVSKILQQDNRNAKNLILKGTKRSQLQFCMYEACRKYESETWEQACEMEKGTGNGKGTSARDSDLQEGEMCFQSHNGTGVHSCYPCQPRGKCTVDCQLSTFFLIYCHSRTF